MTQEPATGHLLTPADPEVARRATRLRELQLGENAEQEFDEFAQELARTTEAPFAMVNFMNDDHQYFAGLYASPHVQGNAAGPGVDVGRVMPRDHGYCPHVVARRLPLVLDDVCDYPRFAGNPVVDKIGIRSYLGAPLIDDSGTTLGTICVVDREQRPWGRPGLELIKTRAAELMERIRKRAVSAE
ncbi:GAF domain-containing protein [Haloactinospora alba]|uniref:GAF domain-containing protein n=1 Tax=Haloactinospora alba TaxID=405555 RepID=A0A543NNH9_9ACTN|nr:GAF domain-containing protein [Haloactinospora alba]TQN33388.1 GAF domain-containing protein [Haloactinospora alba]